MSLWLQLKYLIELNPYLGVLFAISVTFWALFFKQLMTTFDLKNKPLPVPRVEHKKPWINFWYAQTQLSFRAYQMHKHLTLMKALLVALPMVGLAGTVMMLANGFETLSLSDSVDLKSFSSIVTGAMATTFAGVFLSVIGMLLFKFLNITMKKTEVLL